MSWVLDRSSRNALALAPAAIIVVGYGCGLLSRELIMNAFGVLALWLTLALSVGILVGHCIPEEDCA